jgi:hypothetical protein
MTRRRIGLLVTLALGLLMAPLAAEAQPPTHVHQIGALSGIVGTTPGRDPFVEAFLEGMRALGYVEGQNLGFFAQPLEKVYFRDDAIATGSGMTRIGNA